MTVRGKHGKAKPRLPPFPPLLEITEKQRDFHIPTASAAIPIQEVGTTKPAAKHQPRGWAKLNCRSGPNIVAKRKSLTNVIGDN